MEKEKTDQVRGFLSKCGAKSFDLVMCFSVTMWIHLNRGDKGLAEFLGLCCSLSRNVLVEPQPWKCYKVFSFLFFCFYFFFLIQPLFFSSSLK